MIAHGEADEKASRLPWGATVFCTARAVALAPNSLRISDILKGKVINPLHTAWLLQWSAVVGLCLAPAATRHIRSLTQRIFYFYFLFLGEGSCSGSNS